MSGVRIRKVELSHFRCVETLEWFPTSGINCVIGPGDSGKSTVLEAIDLCLGARRTVQLRDTDFYELDVSKPLRIAITIGDLDERLKSLEDYGLYLRGFRSDTRQLLPEPEAHAEPVLTVQLTAGADLEPMWSLFSERAASQNSARNLNWADRQRIAPTRIGSYADHHLGWRRGSVLNCISEERADALAALAEIGREARLRFGEAAKAQVPTTIRTVETTAKNVGVMVGTVTALLDPDSVSFTGGTIALHDGRGVPLRDLGLGSVRLLIAGLQREAAGKTSIILVDEIEHGLEPHRLIQFTTSLGSKEKSPPLQAFVTTHSPVACRELSAAQLHVLRKNGSAHEMRAVDADDDMQATIRACPEAFLAPSVIVCEGASEIGLMRGLDRYLADHGGTSLMALGVALADGAGDNSYRRAGALAHLGYRTLILRDDDKSPSADDEQRFAQSGGRVIKWRENRSLEQELFSSLSGPAVLQLIDAAVDHVGEQRVDANIRTVSSGNLNLHACRQDVTTSVRSCLGSAAKRNDRATKRSGWMKTITTMEAVAYDIVGPDLASQRCDAGLSVIINDVFAWARDGR